MTSRGRGPHGGAARLAIEGMLLIGALVCGLAVPGAHRPAITTTFTLTSYDGMSKTSAHVLASTVSAQVANSPGLTQQLHSQDDLLDQWVGFVAAETATGVEGITPQVIRAGDLKLPGVPKGAVGSVIDNGKGLTYAIPRGTPEIDPRVTQIRIMGPTTGKYANPNGYAVYMNGADQTVNPLTGRVIAPSDPYAHIGLP